MKFSDNLININHCGTFEFFNLMIQKIADGEDITPLVAGELHQPTPIEPATAGIDAIKAGKIKYTLNTGIPELREEICNKLKRDNNLSYSPDEIMVSCGAKHAIYNAVFTTCGEGDEVIIFAPYYPSYPDIIKLCKAIPKIIELTSENNFQIEYEMLKQTITDKTRLIIINKKRFNMITPYIIFWFLEYISLQFLDVKFTVGLA